MAPSLSEAPKNISQPEINNDFCDNNDDIVITGISGRFPNADNIEEFWNQLVSGTELSTCDDSRWPVDFFGLPPRFGKMKCIERFDAEFFKMDDNDADMMDPQIRILLEVTYEAICDAGIAPDELRGTKTAHIMGCCYDNTSKEVAKDLSKKVKTTYGPAEISFFFDFKGPTFSIDTACASSFSGFNEGILLMNSGFCDSVVISGVAVHLCPAISRGFFDLRMISADGRSKCLDASVDGYCRSEAVVALLLQRRKVARRIYASVLTCKTNADGFKPESITFPGLKTQRQLLQETIKSGKVDPQIIDYIEAHVTGTAAGDPIECRAIMQSYRENNEKPLLFGCLKSNMGHTEGASANCSIIKVALIFQKHFIPPNINFKTPNPNIEDLIENRIVPVLQAQKYHGTIIPVNSFGFGGVNVHALLKANEKVVSEESFRIDECIPRLVNICGRLEESVNHVFDWIMLNRKVVTREFLHLLNNVAKTPLESGMFYRGFAIIDKENILRKKVLRSESRKPLWFVFSALGCQWRGMANGLMQLEPFAQSVQKSAHILKSANIDLMRLLLDEQCDIENDIINAIVSIVCMQIALVDVLYTIGIKPDGIVGHSLGEVVAGYADGCLSAEEAIWIGYFIAKCSYEAQKTKGTMAVVGLNWDRAVELCPSGVYPACDNANESVTVTGEQECVKKFVEQLVAQNVFAKEVQSCDIAFHCPKVYDAYDSLVKNLSNVIKNAKLRSHRWITTSAKNEEEGKLAGAKYFANNVVSPVKFRKAMKFVPQNACVLEVGPHALLLPNVKRCSNLNSTCIAMMRKGSKNNIADILSALGETYINGQAPAIENIYPKVSYPVPRETASISQLIKWDHSKKRYFCKFPDHFNLCKDIKGRKIDLLDRSFKFLEGHCIDGRNLFPATGYLFLIWTQVGFKYGFENINSLPVEFKSVKFHRATIIPQYDSLYFGMEYCEHTNSFVITESDSVCVTGKIYFPVDKFPQVDANSVKSCENTILLKQTDIYKELRIRGYDYGESFQNLIEAKSDGSRGKLKWPGHWVSFSDSLLHLSLLATKTRTLCVPTYIDYLRCDPRMMLEAVEKQETLDAFFDKDCNLSYTAGIFVKGLKASPIPRRLDSRAPKLEYCKFIPYDEHISTPIEQINRIDAFYKHCINLLQKLKSNSKESTKSVKKSAFHEDNGFVSKLEDAVAQEKDFEEFFSSLTSEDKNCFIFHSNYDEIVDTQLRVIIENLKLKLINVIEYNETNLKFKDDFENLSHVYLSKCDYNLLSSLADQKMILPQNISKVDVVLYKDISTDLVCSEKFFESIRNLENFVNSAYDTLNFGGFLMIYYRNYLSNLEKDILALRDIEENNFDQKCNPIEEIITKSKFTLVAKRTDDLSMVSLVLKKNSPILEPIIINTEVINYNWIEDLKAEIKRERDNRIWLMAKNSEINGLIGITRCLAREIGNKRVRCLISSENYVPEDIQKRDLIFNMVRNGTHGIFCHKTADPNKSLIETEHAYLDVKTKGDLSSFRWFEAPHKYWPSLLPNERDNERFMIYVYYSALNFKDVMVSTGRVPLSAYPLEYQEGCSIGMEFSGKDENGKRIFGFCGHYAIATTLMLRKDDFYFNVPPNWSLEEASSVSVVYATVYYALLIRGALKHGEKVLIHAGSGGVGQAAISVCLRMGCEVFTSVGTEEKKNYLKKRFPQMKDKHFVNSRDLTFEEHILKETNGRGVDIILNSLAEEKLRASVNCLAEFGRFVEIGKYDLVQDNSFDGVKMENNRTFHVVCFGYLMHEFFHDRSANAIRLCSMIKYFIAKGLENGEITPLQTTVFDKEESEKAFRFMASGKHIGKVLLKIRDEAFSEKRLAIKAIPQMFCHPSKVYIIFGGLGGLGLELGFWLCKRGARKLVLTSRSGVKEAYQSYMIKNMENEGAKVVLSVNDASTFEKTLSLIKESMKLGPIGGVFNLAMVLIDAVLETQPVEIFQKVCVPKADITVYLDKITRELCPQLEYFVCFSSAASGRGNAGQSNYGFANSVMDSICEKRRRDGLHGIAFQWGAIGDVGFVAKNISNDVVVAGTVAQRIPSFINVLDTFLGSQYSILLSIVLADNNTTNFGKGDLLKTICHILGFSDTDSLEESTTVGELGLDSLMAVEIKQGLERDYNTILSTQEIRNLTVKEIREISKRKICSKRVNTDQENTYKFDKFELPKEIYVKLDDGNQGVPIFFFPPVEGDFSSMKPLVKYISRPVIGINWVEQVDNLNTIEEVAAFYVKKLREDYPLPEYNFVAYSFGSLLAFEIAVQLQQIGTRLIKKLIVLDGSIDYLKTATDALIKRAGGTDENQAFQELLIFFISLFYPIEAVEKLKMDLLEMKTKAEKIERAIDFMRMLGGIQCSPDLLTKTVERYFNKMKRVYFYEAKNSFKGDVKYVCSTKKYSYFADTIASEEYEKYKELIDGNFEVIPKDGDHRTFLTSNYEEIGNFIESQLYFIMN